MWASSRTKYHLISSILFFFSFNIFACRRRGGTGHSVPRPVTVRGRGGREPQSVRWDLSAQIGALSLVQIHPDKVLRRLYHEDIHSSRHPKSTMKAIASFCCVFIAIRVASTYGKDLNIIGAGVSNMIPPVIDSFFFLFSLSVFSSGPLWAECNVRSVCLSVSPCLRLMWEQHNCLDSYTTNKKHTILSLLRKSWFLSPPNIQDWFIWNEQIFRGKFGFIRDARSFHLSPSLRRKNW